MIFDFDLTETIPVSSWVGKTKCNYYIPKIASHKMINRCTHGWFIKEEQKWKSGEIAASPVACLLFFFFRFTTNDANISKQKDKWQYQSLILKSVPEKLWSVTCLENRSRKERMPPAAAWSDDGVALQRFCNVSKGWWFNCPSAWFGESV